MTREGGSRHNQEHFFILSFNKEERNFFFIIVRTEIEKSE